ncbi:phage tail tape measure protein [Pseudomonas entomophila]|uniref:phage tail tape measure protein n=1 Tax=Pseudomonas entomophila TaxID=312306 RepID=UPI0015E458D6|nr:phage tail tape measure protein [Pseudomonas entomophila]MBA1187970.1 phage tail tape measure protein [Pseudomonas entomophila]
MSSKLALAVVIGGAVSSSVGAAFKNVEGRIDKLEKQGNKAKALKGMIGETVRLREEWRKAHESGAANAGKLLDKLEANNNALRKQGVEVGRLASEYARLGQVARASDLQMKGHQQIEQGRASLKSNIGQAVVATGLAAVPTKISADYQAIIRDIAIKADIVNQPGEAQLNRTVIDTASDTGMSRNDVADLVNQLVGAGMELDKALSYAPVAAKFAIGQGASGVDTASMIQALEQNAKISDPRVMQQALEAIAYQGQAGSFEASDMAKWFPQLLAGMEKNGITGLDAVTSLGSMLQVQMKTAGSSDEAANNFKNWMEKLGAGDVVKAYKDAGIDYQASLNTGLQKGMNVIEASMALAMKYVKATDPAKAKKIEEAKANIDKEADPEKAKAALEALEKTLRTGDIFADMQVKAALTAYGQNRGLYEELKADSKKASGILDKNLAERRETSAQQWAELGQAVDDSMRSIGDAIRPVTDGAAKGLTKVARGITKLSDGAQPVVLGITAITAAFLGLRTAASAFKIGRGLLNLTRGRVMERGAGRASLKPAAAIQMPKTGNKLVDVGLGALGQVLGAGGDEPAAASNEPQRVFVVNASDLGGIGSSVANSAPVEPAKGGSRSRRQRRQATRRQRRAASPIRSVSVTRAGKPVVLQERPVPPKAVPKPPAAPAAPAAAAGRIGKAAKLPERPAVPKPAVLPAAAAGQVGKLAKLGQLTALAGKAGALTRSTPGGAVFEAGTKAIDTFINAKTQDEKAEGYGGAAGGLAGTLAGMAAGAAIGSAVPVIGTAIGGAIGAYLGSMGGDAGGSWLGKKLFGSDDKDEDEPRQSPPAEEGQPAKPLEAEAPTKPADAVTVAPVVVKPGPVVVPPAAPSQPVKPLEAKPADAVAVPPVVVKPGPVVVPPAVPSQPAKPLEAKALAKPAGAESKPIVAPTVLPAPPLPAVGDAVPKQAKPAAEGRVSYDPRDPDYEDAFVVPALVAGRVRFPGADLVPPAVKPEWPPERKVESSPRLPPAVQAALKLPKATDRPASPLVLPATAQPPAALGDLVREMAMPPAQSAAVLAKAPAPAKAVAPKVEQLFEFKPSLQITVQGDVKDPAQLARELEPHMRSQWEAFAREVAARQASTQLFDAPHV